MTAQRFENLRRILREYGPDPELCELALVIAEPVIERMTGTDLPLEPTRMRPDEIHEILMAYVKGKRFPVRIMSIEKDGMPIGDAGKEWDDLLAMAKTGVVPLGSALDPTQIAAMKDPEASRQGLATITTARQKIAEGRPGFHEEDAFIHTSWPRHGDPEMATKDPKRVADGCALLLDELAVLVGEARDRLGSMFWDQAERWTREGCDEPFELMVALLISTQEYLTMALSGNAAMVARFSPLMQMLRQAVPLAWQCDAVPAALLVITR